MNLKKVVARYKDVGGEWFNVTNSGMPFFSEEGLLTLMIEKMQVRYPNVEYQIVDAPEAASMARFSGFSF